MTDGSSSSSTGVFQVVAPTFTSVEVPQRSDEPPAVLLPTGRDDVEVGHRQVDALDDRPETSNHDVGHAVPFEGGEDWDRSKIAVVGPTVAHDRLDGGTPVRRW